MQRWAGKTQGTRLFDPSGRLTKLDHVHALCRLAKRWCNPACANMGDWLAEKRFRVEP